RVSWTRRSPGTRMGDELIDICAEVAAATGQGRAVVALESTLIAHGLPWPDNLSTALAAEEAIRAAGAIPATIAVLAGRPTVGLAPLGVPVVGYQTDTFPAFYLTSSRLPVPARVNAADEAAALLAAHWRLGGAGVAVAQPLPAYRAFDPATYERALAQAEQLA